MEFLWEKLQQTKKPIVLYGMGNGADRVIAKLNEYGLKPAGVFSSSGFVRPKRFHNMPLTDYKTAKNTFKDMVVLLCFGTALPDVINQIMAIAAENELYIPDVPVYGNNYFDRDFYSKNEEKIAAVLDLLADEKSKQVYREIINFKADGNFTHLLNCATNEEEIPTLLNYNNDETYLDLGAFNGDTILKFTNAVKKYNKIIAAEPDRKSFKRLKENTSNFENIDYMNAAISNHSGTTEFSDKGGRGNSLAGKIQTPVTTVDDLLNGQKITLLKMDIEGEEQNAIKGAAKTIKAHHPKMQIAAYHRSEDIFEIPLQIHNIAPDYQIYLRHFPCFPAWDTNYFFI